MRRKLNVSIDMNKKEKNDKTNRNESTAHKFTTKRMNSKHWIKLKQSIYKKGGHLLNGKYKQQNALYSIV